MKYYCDNTLLYTFTPASFSICQIQTSLFQIQISLLWIQGFLSSAIPTSIMDGNTAMSNAITRPKWCTVLSQT